MNLAKRISGYIARRDTLKYRLYKFIKKHSNLNDNSPVIVIWEMGGFSDIMKKNAILSAALNLRGYKTHFIVCDGIPEACIQRGLEKNEEINSWQNKCYNCTKAMRYVASQYSVEYSMAGDYISDDKKQEFKILSETIDLEDIFDYKFLDVEAGQMAWSSVIRYMKGYVLERKDLKKEDEILLRKYFYAALVNTFVANEVIAKFRPVSILSSHGVYVDYSPAILLSYIKGITSLCWSSGFKDFLHYFTVPQQPNRLIFRGISESEWKKRADKPMSSEENLMLDEYIHHRFHKGNKRDFLNITLPEPVEVLKNKLGINNGNKTVCLFCHVSWDLTFSLCNMIFDNANQWLEESFKVISDVKDVNWIIRVHPGEKPSGSLYTNDDFIKKKFQEIPSHIKILWSDSEINSYGLYKMIDAGITLFGTMGAELPMLGKPVISGGEAHFTGKGFTIDAKSKEEYFKLLKEINSLPQLTDRQIELARQYAYSYFIQRQIPINVITQSEGHWGNLDLEKINRLLPGKDIILDEICSSIVKGKDVILDENMVKEIKIDL